MEIWIVSGAISLLVLSAALIGWHLERRRVEQLRRAAQALGLAFHAKDPFDLAARYIHLDALRQGSHRYAFNVLHGVWRGYTVTVFDYHYETRAHSKKGSRTHRHYLSGAALRLPRRFPELRVRPETLLDKFGELLGFEDIDFESIEFSRAYRVKARERKFAYDVFHPRMMELFLERRDLVVEIDADILFQVESGKTVPDRIGPRLNLLARIREGLPEYLLQS